jgi:hypothetical protein
MHVCVCTRQLIICCKAAKSTSPKPAMHEQLSIEKVDAAVFSCMVMFADDLIHSNECLTWVC